MTRDDVDGASWFRATQVSRRTFAATTVAGYAALTQPVCAAVITTPADGLVAGRIAIAATDREIPGYRARPSAGANWPVILLLSEIWGVHAWIEDIARRLAHAGYYVIAPDYFVRAGNAAAETDINVLFQSIVLPTPDTQVLADSRAALAFAAGEGAATSRLGVTGFCWGGRQTWLHVAALPDVKAGVAWYGKLSGERTANQPAYPVDVAAKVTRPVLGLYGELDSGIPLETVEAMRAALKAARSPSEIIIYRQAPHGFHADYRPSYRPLTAQAAWRACLAWFGRNL